MRRFGQVIRVLPEKLQEYKRLHADPWPEVLAALRDHHVTNYSIFHHADLLFAYFEYLGEDFAADMAQVAADPITRDWWALTDPCQEPVATAGEGVRWAEMEEVFHMR
jgi:L-rhamnose mutarotase